MGARERFRRGLIAGLIAFPIGFTFGLVLVIPLPETGWNISGVAWVDRIITSLLFGMFFALLAGSGVAGQTAEIAAEADNNFKKSIPVWRNASTPAAIGGVIGFAIGYAVGLFGSWPQTASLALPSALVGAYVGARSVFRRAGWINRDNIWDASVDGFLVTGGIAFCAVAVWIFIGQGAFDVNACAFAFLLVGFIGAFVNVWRRCIELKLYPRWRFAIGAVLAASSGVAITFGSLFFMSKHPATFDPVMRLIRESIYSAFGVPTPNQQIRGALAFGIVLGLGVYLLGRRWKPLRSGSRRSAGTGEGHTGAAVDAFIDAGHKIGAFAAGLAYLGGAAGLVAFNLWQGDYQSSTRDIFGFDPYIASGVKLFHLIFYVCAVVLAFMGLREWRAAFKAKPRLRSEGVYGNAGDASLEEAQQAMRGGRSPVDDRYF